MRALLESQIRNGDYTLTDILEKIDTFWAIGKLTTDERTQLTALARDKAAPSQESDIWDKILELETRLTALEKGTVTDPDIPAPDEVIEEYIPGKWYHNGDYILYKNNVYACENVPEGQVCVWSPDDMPSYWTLVKPNTPTTEPEPTEDLTDIQPEEETPGNV